MGERRASASLGAAMAAAAAAVVLLGLVVAAEDAPETPSLAVEVEVLVAVRAALRDPGNVLADWVANSEDPCRWRMVICDGGRLRGLDLSSMDLSGTLSPEIGKLWRLENLILRHNAISGPIPDNIGDLRFLQRLDLSDNKFTGTIPASLGDPGDLFYMNLSNNKLSGAIPDSLATARSLFNLDLSFNNLSGTSPVFSGRAVTLDGNPLVRRPDCGEFCSSELQDIIVLTPAKKQTRRKNSAGSRERILLYVATILLIVLFFVLVAAIIWQLRRSFRLFAELDGQRGPEIYLGHLKSYMLKEIQEATNNFSLDNILGQGGFGVVYKGYLHDGTIVAIKRLKDFISDGGEDQFHTEVEVISLVVHRNLIRLNGFCTTDDERLLVYPYMSNGSVASKLQEHVDGKPALDWPRRKRIALGAARGLVYLHVQCDPKIIHRDIKASNILLDEHLEALVADYGLAKLLDHGDSHVITTVRGTIGRIPPEYVLVGQSSEKTDVYGFGYLLIELITGRKTLELHENEHPNGGMLEWARELLNKDHLRLFVDTKLGRNYDNAELKEMVQIALLCTMHNPTHRPSMSEVVTMLEGDGSVAERWESLKDVEDEYGTLEFPLPVFVNYVEDEYNSTELEAVELSGPR